MRSIYRLCQLLDLAHAPEIRRNQGVSLRDCQRQQGIASPDAIRADGAAEEEFKDVTHGAPDRRGPAR